MSYSSPTGPIGFREEGVDIAAKYVGNADAGKIWSFLDEEGKAKYGFGSLYAWGRNTSGQLGTSPQSTLSPSQVGTSTNWSQVSGGANHSLAITTNGTLWAGGFNSDGQLGDGTITHRSSPVQIGALTNWSQVSGGANHSLAVRTNGTLWSWGSNVNGRLGDGTTTGRSSPVQIGALTNWAQVSAGTNHSLAVKTDGTLWAWGLNGGILGDGTTTHRSSPVQIGALTDWRQVSTGSNGTHSLAVKTDGTLWAWGENLFGQLGDNTLTPKSSPVQIGSLTSWHQVSGGGSHSLGILV
jgi:alpha-tubulin suppressor-like RCC1 family protein